MIYNGNAEAFKKFREISVLDIQPLRIGQVEDTEAATMLNPLMSMQKIHAVVLSGGSAFGLGAGNGVMQYLEEHDIGFDTGVAKVPLVVQSDIYDLTVGSAAVRPDSKMGYAAAKAAFETPNYKDGNYGAGCGASVGSERSAEWKPL